MSDDILIIVGASEVLVTPSEGPEIIVNAEPDIDVLVQNSGPPGPAGGAAAGYNFTQATPSSTWTINHNLGYRPSVELFTVGGVEFEAEVTHTSVNQAVVNINVSIAGSARLV